MNEIERKARGLLASEYTELGIEPQAARLMGQGHQPGGVHYAAVKAIIAALTPPEGYALVPVEPTEEMVLAAKLFQGDHDNVDNWLEWEGVSAANQYRAMLAARPEGMP